MTTKPLPLCLLDRAIMFAVQAHAGQPRKAAEGTIALPYIVHPLGVMTRLVRHGIKDEVTLAAAVLHDVVEDCEVPIAQVIELFGEEVGFVVAEVSDPPNIGKRKAKELQVLKAPTMSMRAKLVKLADKGENVNDIIANPPGWKTESIIGYTQSSMDVVNALGSVHPGLEAEFFIACDAVVRAVGNPKV